MWCGEKETNICGYSVPSSSKCSAYIISFNPHDNSVLQMRPLRLKEVKYFAQCYTPVRGDTAILIEVYLILKRVFFPFTPLLRPGSQEIYCLAPATSSNYVTLDKPLTILLYSMIMFAFTLSQTDFCSFPLSRMLLTSCPGVHSCIISPFISGSDKNSVYPYNNCGSLT